MQLCAPDERGSGKIDLEEYVKYLQAAEQAIERVCVVEVRVSGHALERRAFLRDFLKFEDKMNQRAPIRLYIAGAPITNPFWRLCRREYIIVSEQ